MIAGGTITFAFLDLFFHIATQHNLFLCRMRFVICGSVAQSVAPAFGMVSDAHLLARMINGVRGFANTDLLKRRPNPYQGKD